jgi:hypothetical protein
MICTTTPKQLPLHLHLLGKVMVLILILLGLGSIRGRIVGLDSAHNKKIAKSYIKLQKKEVGHSSTSMRESRLQRPQSRHAKRNFSLKSRILFNPANTPNVFIFLLQLSTIAVLK